MNCKQVAAKVRAFLESMYGLPSYDEDRFRDEIRTLVRPPEGQAGDKDEAGRLTEEEA